MLLAVDVGNTNVTLGLFAGNQCVQFWRLSSNVHRTEDEYAILMHQLLAMHHVSADDIRAVSIGSVVPVLSSTLDGALNRVTHKTPFHVSHDTRLPVRNLYAKPREVGIDRLANAAGGMQIAGFPLIVVDLGTAVTLDVVSKDREYLGGSILPGIEMSAEALARRTARLPLTAAKAPHAAIGRTTVESIRSGIFLGLAGSIDGLIHRMWKELGYETSVLATGGLAPAIIEYSTLVREHCQELTLIGLKAIYEMNHE